MKKNGLMLDCVNVGENTMLRFWRREDFPEAWLLRATSSTQTCQLTFWCTVKIFSLWADVRDEIVHWVCSEVHTSWAKLKLRVPSRHSVSDSEFLGQNTDIATMVNRVRVRAAVCFPRLGGFGIDRCQGSGDSWNRWRGGAQVQPNQRAA